MRTLLNSLFPVSRINRSQLSCQIDLIRKRNTIYTKQSNRETSLINKTFKNCIKRTPKKHCLFSRPENAGMYKYSLYRVQNHLSEHLDKFTLQENCHIINI